jgi:dipeptide/tripeptide permease
MTTSAVLVWLGVQTSEPIWSLTCLSLALGVLGMVEGPFWATAVEVGGARGGFSAAVVNTGGNGMGLLAPIATPWIADKLELGWEAGIAVAGTVCLAGALCWLGINQSTGVDPEPLEIDFNGSPSPATPAP